MPEPHPHSAHRAASPAASVAAPPRAGNGILFGPGGLRAGWGIALFVVLFALFMALQAAILRRAGTIPSPGAHVVTPATTVWNDLPACLSVLVVTLLLARIEGRPFGAYGLGGLRRLPHFVAGLFCGLVALSLLVLALVAAGWLHFDQQLLTGASALRSGVIWVGCFLLVALFEETLLRGYLQITLARGISAIVGAISSTQRRDEFGFWAAALLLSLLFGAGHHGNVGESPLGMGTAAAAGLVFCLSLWLTGSLWWAIGFHAAWDWAQSFLYGVADSGIVSAGRLFSTHPVGRPLLSGGLTGPEGSIIVMPVMLGVSGVLLLLYRRTRPTQAPPPASNAEAN